MRVHEPLSVIDLLDIDSATHSWSIAEAQRAIAAAGRGVIVLLHRPESADELRRRALDDAPPPGAKMDLRNYGIGAQILRDLNVGRMRLLAKPRKMPSMAGFDLEVTGYDGTPGRARARPRASPSLVMPIEAHRAVALPAPAGASASCCRASTRRSARACCAVRCARCARAGVAEDDVTLVTRARRARDAACAAAPRADAPLRRAGRARRGDPRRHVSLRDRRERVGRAACSSVQLETGIPIGNGILTCDTDEQARARMDAKGYEATLAALELANLLARSTRG